MHSLDFNEASVTKVKFTNAISWLRDTGVLDKVKYEAMNPPIPIPDPTVRHNQPLILRQLGIIMLVLVVGLAIGIIAFFVELFIRSKSGKTQEWRDGIILIVCLAIKIIVFFVELYIRFKSGQTQESRDRIELKERVERHHAMRTPAASGLTPVIIV